MNDNSNNTNHFRQFSALLTDTILVMGLKNAKSLQKKQLETLVKLERKFRRELIKSRPGMDIFREFIHYICNVRRNILSARPYFRVRQKFFTAKISPALKARSEHRLSKFHFNFQFIKFAINARDWNKKHVVYMIYKQISDLREQMVIANMPLALSRARLFYSKTPKSHLEHMDFAQISAEGLIKAIDKFVLPFRPQFRAVIVGRILGDQIENYSVDQDTILYTVDNIKKNIKDFAPGDKILGVNHEGEIIETDVVALHDHGMLQGYEITFDDGYQIVCSENHKFLTHLGMSAIREICTSNLEILCDYDTQGRWMADPLRNADNGQGEARSTSKGVSDVPGQAFYGPQKVDGLAESMRCGFGNKAEDVSSSQGMSDVRNGLRSGMFGAPVQGDGRQAPTGGLGRLLLGHNVSYQAEAGSAHEGLREVSVGYSRHPRYGSQDTNPRLEGGQSRQGSRQYGPGEQNLSPAAPSRPGISQNARTEDQPRLEQDEGARSRGLCGQDEEGLVSAKGLESGSMATFQRGADLGGGSDLLWYGAQAGRLCVPRSQDLGRSGRHLSLQGDLGKPSTISEGPSQGRDVERGSDSTWRRDVDQIGYDVLRRRIRSDEERLAYMAHKNAPLASTGSLVRRRVVRVRAVGERKMFDLEVSHPKHNFLLPNGIVTSNSETLIHFWPSDRRKLYNSNKLIGRLKAQGQTEVDYSVLATQVNEKISGSATADEISNLMAAASTVSSDTPIVIGDDEVSVSQRFSAPIDAQPDVQVENNEAMSAIFAAAKELSVVERKLLRLKGVGL